MAKIDFAEMFIRGYENAQLKKQQQAELDIQREQQSRLKEQMDREFYTKFAEVTQGGILGKDMNRQFETDIFNPSKSYMQEDQLPKKPEGNWFKASEENGRQVWEKRSPIDNNPYRYNVEDVKAIDAGKENKPENPYWFEREMVRDGKLAIWGLRKDTGEYEDIGKPAKSSTGNTGGKNNLDKLRENIIKTFGELNKINTEINDELKPQPYKKPLAKVKFTKVKAKTNELINKTGLQEVVNRGWLIKKEKNGTNEEIIQHLKNEYGLNDEETSDIELYFNTRSFKKEKEVTDEEKETTNKETTK
jgi:hypothetical protein